MQVQKALGVLGFSEAEVKVSVNLCYSYARV